MEQLTINIPESKSAEIRGFLKSMGVLVDNPKVLDMDTYRAKIAKIGTWSDDDLKAFEENRKAFARQLIYASRLNFGRPSGTFGQAGGLKSDKVRIEALIGPTVS